VPPTRVPAPARGRSRDQLPTSWMRRAAHSIPRRRGGRRPRDDRQRGLLGARRVGRSAPDAGIVVGTRARRRSRARLRAPSPSADVAGVGAHACSERRRRAWVVGEDGGEVARRSAELATVSVQAATTSPRRGSAPWRSGRGRSRTTARPTAGHAHRPASRRAERQPRRGWTTSTTAWSRLRQLAARRT